MKFLSVMSMNKHLKKFFIWLRSLLLSLLVCLLLVFVVFFSGPHLDDWWSSLAFFSLRKMSAPEKKCLDHRYGKYFPPDYPSNWRSGKITTRLSKETAMTQRLIVGRGLAPSRSSLSLSEQFSKWKTIDFECAIISFASCSYPKRKKNFRTAQRNITPR